MINCSCVEHKSDSLVQVKENGQKATFINKNNDVIECIKCDDCVMPQQTASDYVVSKYGSGDVIVELKGKNVEHGAKQILATASHWTSNKYRAGKIAGLIVCRQYPSGSTSVQKAKDTFRKLYKAPLHVITRDVPLDFDNVYSFKGPHKS